MGTVSDEFLSTLPFHTKFEQPMIEYLCKKADVEFTPSDQQQITTHDLHMMNYLPNWRQYLAFVLGPDLLCTVIG